MAPDAFVGAICGDVEDERGRQDVACGQRKQKERFH